MIRCIDNICVDRIVDNSHEIADYLKNDDNNVMEMFPDGFSVYLDQNSETVRNYVIISNEVEKCNDLFISNNIINPTGKTLEQIKKEAEWILSNFGKDRKMSDNTFFISDTHFNHRNIIQYCNRPWNKGIKTNEDGSTELIVDDECIEKMTEDMIKNWNSVVGKNDIVWHLGDFALGDRKKIPDIVSKLNGKINLVMGNHDHNKIGFYYDAGFHRVYDRPVIINDFFILSHTPTQWVKDGGVYANIFGHVHDQEMYKTMTKNTCCVCVERWNYTPVSWKTIREGLDKLNS